jgi:hypothetical protein
VALTVQPSATRLRMESPTLARARRLKEPVNDQFVRRRIGWIWGLLFFNVLGHANAPSLLPITSSTGKILTEGALGVALVIALSINPRALIRPNLFLGLFTILCVTSMVTSVESAFIASSIFRATRLLIFVLVLWLITPWWGRIDFLQCRVHVRALAVVLGSVVIGLMIAPGAAFSQAGGGRLGGELWPIPPTQVAHYAAVFTGLSIVLWFSGMLAFRWAAIAGTAGFSILILTHTRTALIGAFLGILVGGLSLFMSRKRVRTAFSIALVIVALGLLSFAPFFNHWFARGQSSQEIAALTGRSQVWSQLLAEPRSEVRVLFGFGMSNDGFNGLSIDSSWLSTYLDQGLVGDILIGSALILLLLKALISPRGPGRAIALFLVVYCLVASFTETGLGNASTYLMDLSVAMAVLMAPLIPSAVALEE